MGKTSFSFLLQTFLFLFCIAFNFIPAVSQDLQVLLQIKGAFKNTTLLSYWSQSSPDYCSWPEISCSSNGFVTHLSLALKDLTDPFPPAICSLSFLTHLNLTWNYLPGAFPTSLYNCSNLQSLDLSQNYFVGPLPSDINRLSPSLLFLHLYGNNFSGQIPPSLGRLSSLVDLRLDRNLFNGSLPPEIGNLANLEILCLDYLSAAPPMPLPKQLGNLQRLKNLWIKQSNLVGEIPQSFTNLIDLEQLDLSENKLTGPIPPKLFTLKKLDFVSLSANRLSGEIPRPIEAVNLTELDLSINLLTGTIPEIRKLQKLKTLFLYYNRLSGEIPACISLLPSLSDIRLFTNNLNGTLPPDWGLYSNLKNLEVSTNRIIGELPRNLCSRGYLRGLVVFGNSLTGKVPDSLGNCSSLVYIQLYNNRFSGEFPVRIWSGEQLEELMIKDNSFSGNLPHKLGPKLARIEMSNNRFSGRIPSNISGATNLSVFLASNNQLSGSIPESLTALPRLERLELDGNMLSGEIPSVIESWKTLYLLNLRNNQLTGTIPADLGSLSMLNILDLSGNELSGEIPPELGKLRLSQLNLSSNRLAGKIPIGLEAFHDSFVSNAGLCSANPRSNPKLQLPTCYSDSGRGSRKASSGLLTIILIVAGVVALAAAFFALFLIRRYQRRKSDRDMWKLTSFQRLDFTEKHIVRGLKDANLIGSGGSGMVYRVPLGNRSGDMVAVKKIQLSGRMLDDKQREKEFESEAKILGRIRHNNIVKLLCCISSDDSKLLVYEYMENGSLDGWLHGKREGACLDWPTRRQIAIGAAEGLCYMHHSSAPPIIHRDVKSSNILLDSNFKARIADFGLARILAKHGEPESVTAVAGSFGYFAPEYWATKRVNEKCDVFSFGVVLMELVTGQKACKGEENWCLTHWVWRHYQERKPMAEVVDEVIKKGGVGHLEDAITVLRLGIICTSTSPSSRPSMEEVLERLIQCGTPNETLGSNKAGGRESDVVPVLHTTDAMSGHRCGSERSDHGDCDASFDV